MKKAIKRLYKAICNLFNKDKNISVGMSHLNDTIEIKTCKYGSDWNHPNCDDSNYKTNIK